MVNGVVLPQCLSIQFGHFSTSGKSHSANVYVTFSPTANMTDFGVCKIKLRFLIAVFRTTGSEKSQNCSWSVSFLIAHLIDV